jgi:acetyl esterase/lipase
MKAIKKKLGKIFLPLLKFVILLLLTEELLAQENNFIKIWPDRPLYSLTSENMERSETDTNKITRYFNVTIPTLEYVKPENPNGTAIIICPGGGYARLSYTYEGKKIAEWFAQRGISAFILKYRLPDDKVMEHKEKVPLADAQQSFNYLKTNAAMYGIDPDKIGIIGFSAGGHLAATVSTHFTKPVIDVNDKINFRPYFSILIYPVITMTKDFTHSGSRNNLLGENPNEELVKEYSNELNVSSNTPITFIVHASDDKTVPVINSINYYQALIKNNVPAAMHIFEKGGHGFAMRNKWVDGQWLLLLDKWLKENRLIVE